ncbi:unnamed protein product, partial [Linum tenue]
RVHAWLTVVRTALDKDRKIHRPDPPIRTEEGISWKSPPPEWVTLNSDGSVLQESGLATAGGLIRDHLGRCLVAFSLNLGACSITQAELKGAVVGLQLAWDMGYIHVFMEHDSRCVVQLIRGMENPNH